jgi:hypothetical protein
LLLSKFETYDRKKFYNIGPWSFFATIKQQYFHYFLFILH